MKVLILQHTATEGAGVILDWCAQMRAEVSYIKLYEPQPHFFLDESFQLIVVLGGPMSVNDQVDYPWLKMEKDYIAQCVEARIPVLGICLGAQLIASSLGAKVVTNPELEIGWHNVESVSNEIVDAFQFPTSLSAFHWHGETFELPFGAIHLAESAGCINQGFQLGDKVIGLQFHPEITLSTIEMWIKDAGKSLKPSAYVQSADEMTFQVKAYLSSSKAFLFEVLNYLVK